MNDGLFDNVILAFEELDLAVMCYGNSPATHAPESVWPKMRAARKREEEAEREDSYRQQEAEIGAETNIPQHLVW